MQMTFILNIIRNYKIKCKNHKYNYSRLLKIPNLKTTPFSDYFSIIGKY